MHEFPPTVEFAFGIGIGAVIFRLFFHGQKIYTGVWIVHGVFIFCRYFPKSGILIFSIFFQIRKFRFFEKSQFFGFFSQNRKFKNVAKSTGDKKWGWPDLVDGLGWAKIPRIRWDPSFYFLQAMVAIAILYRLFSPTYASTPLAPLLSAELC